jgi:NAD(P)H-hydrate epimerase
MERAAGKCFEWFVEHYPEKTKVICVCGQGNNGGDGLALSRMLYLKGYQSGFTLLNPESMKVRISKPIWNA